MQAERTNSQSVVTTDTAYYSTVELGELTSNRLTDNRRTFRFSLASQTHFRKWVWLARLVSVPLSARPLVNFVSCPRVGVPQHNGIVSFPEQSPWNRILASSTQSLANQTHFGKWIWLARELSNHMQHWQILRL